MTSVKQITIRKPSTALTRRLKALSEHRGESLNATILFLLEKALGVNERRSRLERYATWTDEDGEEFDRVLEAQRTIDENLWQ